MLLHSIIYIFSSLQAPTPTRFVGRMHAVVSSSSGSGEKRSFRSASDSFSRKSSIVTDTIREDDDASPSPVPVETRKPNSPASPVLREGGDISLITFFRQLKTESSLSDLLSLRRDFCQSFLESQHLLSDLYVQNSKGLGKLSIIFKTAVGRK